MFFPTTTVDVYRDADDADRNVFGDETETGVAPIVENAPASITLDRVSRRKPADLTGERVATFTIRVQNRAAVREGDRIKDRKNGTTYQVDTLSTPDTVTGVGSTRLTCIKVGVPA